MYIKYKRGRFHLEDDQVIEQTALRKNIDILYLWAESLYLHRTRIGTLTILDLSTYNLGERK